MSHQTWSFRTKPGASLRTWSTIKHWSISPAPIWHNFWTAFLAKDSQCLVPRVAARTWLLGPLGWIQACVWMDFWGDPRSLYNREYTVEVTYLAHSLLDDLIHQIPLAWDVWGPDTKRKNGWLRGLALSLKGVAILGRSPNFSMPDYLSATAESVLVLASLGSWMKWGKQQITGTGTGGQQVASYPSYSGSTA